MSGYVDYGALGRVVCVWCIWYRSRCWLWWLGSGAAAQSGRPVEKSKTISRASSNVRACSRDDHRRAESILPSTRWLDG